jgi:DNA polymerase III subunit beta
MNTTVDIPLNTLKDAVARVKLAVQTSGFQELTEMLLILVDDDGLTFAAYDYETWIVHTVDVPVQGDCAGGGVLAASFKDLVRLLPDDVTLTFTEDSLQIASGPTDATLNLIPAQEYPDPPAAPADGLAFPAGDLQAALRRVTFSASTSGAHPVLTGVLAEFEEETLTLVTADGYRLSRQTVTLPHTIADPFKVLLPASALKKLSRILKRVDEAEEVTFVSDAQRARFRVGATLVTTQLIAGNFPDYQRIINGMATATTIAVERKMFLGACKRARIFNPQMVRLEANGNFVIKAPAEGSGQGETVLDVETDGDEGERSFNPQFLIDALNAVDAERVSLCFNPDTYAAAALEVVEDPSWLHVVMPLSD